MVQLTPVAVTKVKEILTQQNPSPTGLRVAVVGGGCSGFSYHMAFENAVNENSDNVYEFDASKQSKRISANVSGLFGTTRISITDNLMKRCTPAEIQARLVDQVTSSVRWEESMRYLLAQGFTRFIELGPGTALSGFMKRIDKNAQVVNVADVASLESTVKAVTSDA